MGRRDVSVIMDVTESVKQLENEIRILTTQKGALEISVKELVVKRDELLTEMNNLSAKLEAAEKANKEECDKLLSNAKEKVEKANAREAVTVEEQVKVNDKMKEADNLIKSNMGLQKNLVSLNEEAKKKLQKIDAFAELLHTNLQGIKS